MVALSEDAIAVWNRAAMHGGGSERLEGDAALAALLLVHSLVMNGGVAHAIDGLSAEELRAACDAYDKYGFADAAALVRTASTLSRDERGARERDLDGQYEAVIGDDSIIFARFSLHYANSKHQYAPVAEHGR